MGIAGLPGKAQLAAAASLHVGSLLRGRGGGTAYRCTGAAYRCRDPAHPAKLAVVLSMAAQATLTACWLHPRSVQCLLAFQLPPVAMAASSLARAAAAASGNGHLCDSALLAHPAAARRVGTLYRLLEPLVAPLEPLLLAAGIGQHHRARRCHCGGSGGRKLLLLLQEYAAAPQQKAWVDRREG